MIKRALVIPDLHAPYHHPDAINFLYRIKDVFGPFDKYICLGDETDGHAWSYHESDPSLANADLEFERAKKFMKTLYELTEYKCDVMESNHGALAYRKSKSAGLPSQIMLGCYERALEAPEGWNWMHSRVYETLRGKVLTHHGFSSNNTWMVAKERGLSVITGHHHTKFKLHQEYIESAGRMLFAAQAGCLIDLKSDAFKYAENNREKQKLGAMVLYDGIPIMIPMLLNEYGRWIGTL